MKSPRIIPPRHWYWAVFLVFTGQGLVSTVFWTRSPDIAAHLGVDVATVGLLGFLSSVGGLLGILSGGPLSARIGNRFVMIPSFAIVVTSLLLISFAAIGANTIGVAFGLFALGFASGTGGIALNLEGASVDRASVRSLLPSIHGAFSAGSLIGSGLGALLIALSLSIPASFAVLCAVYVCVMSVGLINIPRHSGRQVTHDMNTQEIAQIPSRQERRGVLREARLWGVMFIIFGMVMAEATAATWLPLSLVTNAGLEPATASLGLSLFFAGMTVGRFSGGLVVDRLGRSRTLAIYTVIAVVGILLVSATPLLHAWFIGATLWGLGLSIGFPLCVAAVSYEPRLAPSRVKYVATTGSLSSLVGPPAIGFIGQIFGLFVAFLIPATLLVSGLTSNRHTRPSAEEGTHHESILDLP